MIARVVEVWPKGAWLTAVPVVYEARMTTSEAVYENLLTNPGDAHLMSVLADKLEDEDEDVLAAAFRYGAENGKWPYARAYREKYRDEPWPPEGLEERVYDWDLEGRESNNPAVFPPPSRLPVDLYRKIKRLKDRQYGGVREAFALLGRALRS